MAANPVVPTLELQINTEQRADETPSFEENCPGQ